MSEEAKRGDSCKEGLQKLKRLIPLLVKTNKCSHQMTNEGVCYVFILRHFLEKMLGTELVEVLLRKENWEAMNELVEKELARLYGLRGRVSVIIESKEGIRRISELS